MRISDWSSDVCSSDLIVAGFVTLRAKLLPEDAEAGVLALADLRAERLPLAIGTPDPARIAAAIGGRPERDRIYAAIGLAAGDAGRAGDVGAGMLPRHAPGAGARFACVDDRLRGASVDCWSRCGGHDLFSVLGPGPSPRAHGRCHGRTPRARPYLCRDRACRWRRWSGG